MPGLIAGAVRPYNGRESEGAGTDADPLLGTGWPILLRARGGRCF